MPRFFFFYFFFYCWQTWGGETVVHEIILAWSVFLSGFLSRNCNYFCSFFFVPGLSCRLFFFVRFIGLQVSVMQLFKPPKAPCQMQKNHPKLFLDTGWISCALHFQIIVSKTTQTISYFINYLKSMLLIVANAVACMVSHIKLKTDLVLYAENYSCEVL